MKKHIIRLLTVLVLVILSLSGCAPAGVVESEAPQEAEPEFRLHFLKQSPDAGRAWNTDGIYIYDQQYPESNYNKLIYIDFETGELKALCDIPSCAHDTPGCGAWHEYWIASNVFPTGKDLIWFRDYPIWPVDSVEELPPIIYVSDLDGKNLRLLFEFKDNFENEHCSSATPMLYDDEYLYVIVQILSEENMTRPDIYLYKINLQSGVLAQRTILFSMCEWIDFDICGNAGQDIIALAYESELTDGIYEKINRYIYYRISPETLETTVLSQVDIHQELIQYESVWAEDVVNGQFLALKKDRSAFVRVSIETREETVVFALPEDTDGWRALRLIDGHCVFAKEGDDQKLFTLDPNTSEVYEIAHGYLSSYGDQSRWCIILPEAMSEEAYFVCTLSETIEMPYYYGASIMPVPRECTLFRYAMIDKDDYWNNVPNYRDIDWDRIP